METGKLYVRKDELLEHGINIKKELREEIRLVAKEVDNLEKLVLPMTSSLQAIERNTSDLNVIMKDFAKDQKAHTEKLHSHSVAINNLERDDDVKLEKEKGKWTIIGIITTALVGGGLAIDKWGTAIAEFLFK